MVDEAGNVMGAATRAQCHGGGMLLHPVVHLHLFNSRGELYLQRRPVWKDIQPGRWDTAVGGHVDYGETVDDANQEWWCLTKGGEMWNYGADATELSDGDTYELTFTVGY